MSRILSLALAFVVVLAPVALACDLAVTATADPNASVCNGVYPMLNASATGGDGNYTYQWFRFAAPIEDATSASYQTTTGGYYWVDVTDGTGCVVRSNFVVLGIENPSAEITLSMPLCAGGTAYAEVPDAYGGATYTWSVTNGDISYELGRYLYFTPNGSPVTVEATVTLPSGCSATSSRTENAGVQPTVTITASGPTTFCDGGSVTLTANVADAESFSWNTGQTTPSITVTDTGFYTVTATNGECTASSSIEVDAIETSAQIVSGGGTICAGGTRTITTDVRGHGPWTLTWSDGFTETVGNYGQLSILAYRTVTPAATTEYTIASVSDSTGCPGGTTSGSAHMTVHAPPTAAVSGSTQICPGGAAPVRVELTGQAPWTLTWSDGFVQSVSQSSIVRSVSPAATTTYSVTNVSDNYCATGSGSGSATITVGPPTATVSGGGAICAGGSATVEAALTGKGPWIVTWADGPTISYTSSPAVRTVSPSATTTYSVSSVFDGNCNGTASGSATVTVHALPTVTVSGTTTICAGGSATIQAALTGTAPFTVLWSDGVTTSTGTRTVSPASTTTYSVTSVSDAYCSGTGSSSATITVQPPPTAVVSGNATICAGGSATIQAALTGTAPFTVLWSDGVTTSTGTRTVSPASTTTYTVTSVSDAYCSGTASGSATVTVQPPPTAVVSGTTTICAGGSATIQAALTGTAPFTVLWSDGMTTSTGTRTVSPASTTTYTVTSVSDAYCSGTASGSATITVDPLPVITTQPQSQSIKKNTTVTLTVAASSPRPMTYQWFRGAAGNTSTPVGTNSTSYTTPRLTSTTQYWVRVSSSCGATKNATATITLR